MPGKRHGKPVIVWKPRLSDNRDRNLHEMSFVRIIIILYELVTTHLT